MNVLFLNASINQLVLAKEFISDFGLRAEDCVVVIRKGPAVGRFLIRTKDDAAQFGKWGGVYLVRQYFGKYSLVYLLNFIIYAVVARRVVSRHLTGILALGNYLNEPMRHVANTYGKATQVVFIDEGVSTVNILRDRKAFFASGAHNSDSFRSFVKQKLFRLKPGHVDMPITFYSLLKLKPEAHTKFVKCHYNVLRSTQQVSEYTNSVYFLGGPFAEWEYLTRAESTALFAQVLSYFAPREIVYFPHRRENLAELETWSKESGFKVRIEKMPFEIFLHQSPTRPAHVASYYSYGLVTCIELFRDVMKYHFFRIPDTILRKANKNVAEMYEFLGSTYSNVSYVAFHEMNAAKAADMRKSSGS